MAVIVILLVVVIVIFFVAREMPKEGSIYLPETKFKLVKSNLGQPNEYTRELEKPIYISIRNERFMTRQGNESYEKRLIGGDGHSSAVLEDGQKILFLRNDDRSLYGIKVVGGATSSNDILLI